MANALGTLFQDIANAIRDKTGETESMKPIEFPTKISEINVGGGSSDLVKYVTFMDGTAELFKMPVLSGDDCKDPIAHGGINIPAKESTNTINYTYSGWSMTNGGSADDSALKDVTEDRVVYVAFEESVRYYTVTFYNGSILEKEIQVTYGANASGQCTVTKDGYSFDGWLPDVSNVTENITTYAQWQETLVLENQSWDFISECSANGMAKKYWKIGDSKTFKYNNNTTLTAVIVGFDHDDMSDGSGKAGITFMVIPPWYISSGITTSDSSCKDWSTHRCKKYELNVDNSYYGPMFPGDLTGVVKAVKKLSHASGNYGVSQKNIETQDKLWLPSVGEIIGQGSYSSQTFADGNQYEYFVGKTLKNLFSADIPTRSSYVENSSYATFMSVENEKAAAQKSLEKLYYVPFGFCV